MSIPIYDVAVVGSGAAGSMGVLRSVLNNLQTVCFMGTGDTKRKSRATWVGKVENMPVLFNYPKAIFQSANEVFKWIDHHETWKTRLTSVKDGVEKITGEAQNFTLHTSNGEEFRAKYVVLCTGIMDVQPEIQGSIKPVFPMANAGFIHYCIRCDGHQSINKSVAIIGHQESAPGIACLLKERYGCPKLYVLTNGKSLELADDSPLGARMKDYDIAVHSSPILKIDGDPKAGGLTGFTLEDGIQVPCTLSFVALGVIVHNQLAVDAGCEVDGRGYVVTDESGQTSVKGIFAGGDLRAGKKKQIYTAWDITVDSVDKIDSYIRAAKRTATRP